jgi:hypothetical protein
MALTREEELELEALESEFGQAPIKMAQASPQRASSNLTPEEEAELAQLEAEFAGERNPSQFPVSALGPDVGVIPEGKPVEAPKKPKRVPIENSKGDIVGYRELDDNPADAHQSALESFGNAVSFGYLPHIQAGVESLYSDQPYTELRDENIARQEAQMQRNPGHSIAGMIAGAGATMPIGAGALKGAGVVDKIGKLGSAAVTGAGYGAISNPGDTQGVVDPLQISERASNAGTGALFGGVTQGVGQGVARVGEAVRNAPELAQKVSNVAAVKAVGAIGKDFRKLFRKGSNFHEIGDTLLENKIVAPGDSLEEIAKKAMTAKNEAGKRIGEIYKSASEELSSPEKLSKMSIKDRKLLEITELNGEKLAGLSLAKIEKNLKNDLAGPEVKEKILSTLRELQSKGKNIDILDLQEMKSKLDKRINYDKALKDMPEVQQEFKVIRDKLNKAIQNRIRVYGRVSGNKDLVNELKDVNKKYSHYSKAEAIASDRVNALDGNNFLTLSDKIVGSAIGGANMLTGDSPEEKAKNVLIGFAAGVAGNKSMKYVTPAVAQSAKRLSKLLKTPANMEKFGAPLIEAAKKSPEEFQNFVNSLKSNPEFQKLLKPQGAQ